MTIYHYLASKAVIVEGIVEQVFAEIDLPPEELPWTEAVRVRCLSAHGVLRSHPWAAPLLEPRRMPGPMSLRHHEAVLACLRRGGLSWEMTTRAYAILGSYIYGFAFEEAMLPAGGGEGIAEVAQEISAAFDPEHYPTLAAFTLEHVLQPGYAFGASFEFGLDLILAGLSSSSHVER